MTHTEQRNANEALGTASQALADHAERLDLFVRKTYYHGTWDITAFSTGSTQSAHATATTEADALDQVLDQISRFDNVYVAVGKWAR